MTIKPKPDTLREGEERVVLTLVDKPGVYAVGDRSSADISIFDDAAPAARTDGRTRRVVPPTGSSGRAPRGDRTGELFVRITFDGTGHWENPDNGAYADLTYRRSLEYTVPMTGVFGPGSGFTDIERRDRQGGLMIPNLKRYLVLRPRDQWVGGADRVCGHGTAEVDDVSQGLAVGDPGMPPLVPFKDTVKGRGPFPSGDKTVPERDLCESAVSIDYDKHVLHLRIDGSDSSIKVQHDYNGHRPAPNNLPLQGYDSTGKVKQQLMFIDVPIPDGNRFEGSRVIEKFNNVDGPNHTLFPLRATVKWRVTLDP